MCRSIKVLRRSGLKTTEEELQSAALQFVRKISGYHKPPKYREEVFTRAVKEITDASRRLVKELEAEHAGVNGSQSSGDRA